MKKAEQIYEWFSKLEFSEQFKLSDKYTNSKNPSALTKQEVLEIYLEEVNKNGVSGDVMNIDCKDCSDRGVLYDENGNTTSCPCHYS